MIWIWGLSNIYIIIITKSTAGWIPVCLASLQLPSFSLHLLAKFAHPPFSSLAGLLWTHRSTRPLPRHCSATRHCIATMHKNRLVGPSAALRRCPSSPQTQSFGQNLILAGGQNQSESDLEATCGPRAHPGPSSKTQQGTHTKRRKVE